MSKQVNKILSHSFQYAVNVTPAIQSKTNTNTKTEFRNSRCALGFIEKGRAKTKQRRRTILYFVFIWINAYDFNWYWWCCCLLLCDSCTFQMLNYVSKQLMVERRWIFFCIYNYVHATVFLVLFWCNICSTSS